MRARRRPGASPRGVAEGGDGRKPDYGTWSQEPCLACDLAEKLSPPDIREEEAGMGEQGLPGRRRVGPDGQGLPSRALHTSSSSNNHGGCSGGQTLAPGPCRTAGLKAGREEEIIRPSWNTGCS